MTTQPLFKRKLYEDLADIPVVIFFLVMGLFALALAGVAGYAIGRHLGLWVRAAGGSTMSLSTAVVGGIACLPIGVFLLKKPVVWFLDRFAFPGRCEGSIARKYETTYTSPEGMNRITRYLVIGETTFDVGKRAYDAVTEGMRVCLVHERWSRRVKQIDRLAE